MPDPAAVNSMFGRIARRYDLANRLLSGGVDIWWRRRLVRAVRTTNPRDILDLATGSGDVAFALARAVDPSAEIIGMDFCQPMLDEAQAKKNSGGTNHFANVRFQQGDILSLPFPDASFDAITIAFGLRNLASRQRGLAEMRRVLRPGGVLFVLEFSQPYRWFRPFYFFYLQRVLPAIAGVITGDRDAYVYLNVTIGGFPEHGAIAQEIGSAGFTGVTSHRMTLGIVALHSARR